ncbi:Hypothetical predicted protein [Podarcis lilfordi]|uniref:Uncharacterized protein n=1 Tax=Podarcis lilfordi TaxID=74358 RepID=A0AA35KC75_9SAUR|nr:Hypothetical predicted protein [Podarcis lilfordi]
MKGRLFPLTEHANASSAGSFWHGPARHTSDCQKSGAFATLIAGSPPTGGAEEPHGGGVPLMRFVKTWRALRFEMHRLSGRMCERKKGVGGGSPRTVEGSLFQSQTAGRVAAKAKQLIGLLQSTSPYGGGSEQRRRM